MVKNNTQVTENNKRFNYGIALLRMLMCFIVICCHFLKNSDLQYGFNWIGRFKCFAVPVFMLISFLLSDRMFKEITVQSLAKRLWRLWWPLCGWAIIYFVVRCANDIILEHKFVNRVPELFLQMISGHTLNQSMWFQISLIVLTILFSLIISFCGKEKDYVALIIQIGLLIASMVLQYSLINYKLFGNLSYIWKYPLGRTIEMIPYAVIGYNIGHYKLLENCKHKYMLSIAGLIICAVFFPLQHILPELRNGFGYGGVWRIICSIGLIILAYGLPINLAHKKAVKLIDYITKYTLGIYCMHKLVANIIKVIFDIIGLKMNSLLFCVIVYVICYLICAVMSRVPIKLIKNLV